MPCTGRSGDAPRIAAAEAARGRGRDHHVVVAVLTDRPADGPGLARRYGDRLSVALEVVRGQGVGDRLLALVGEGELDRPGPEGSGDHRDRAAVLAGRDDRAGEAGQE